MNPAMLRWKEERPRFSYPVSVLCNRDQCFHFSGSLITGIQTEMVHWTKTRLGEWLSRKKTAWWAFWSHVTTTINPESAKKNGARVSHLLCVVSAHALDCGVSRSYQPLLVSLVYFVVNVTVTCTHRTTTTFYFVFKRTIFQTLTTYS